MKMTGFLHTGKPKAIPWNRGRGGGMLKDPHGVSLGGTHGRSVSGSTAGSGSFGGSTGVAFGGSTGGSTDAGLREDVDTGRRPNASSIWKVVVFIVLITALALYAKSHWPSATSVFSLKGADKAINGANLAEQEQDFFIEFRLDREKTEKEQIDLVKQVMDDETASKEARDAATAQYLSMVDLMGKELRIEGILKAKGWDSLVFLSPDACTVVVKAPGLETKEATQIGDVVRRISRVKLENVTIIPVGK